MGKTWAEYVRALRKERLQLTQEKFGELIGRDQATVNRWENNGKPPTPDEAQALDDQLGLDGFLVEAVLRDRGIRRAGGDVEMSLSAQQMAQEINGLPAADQAFLRSVLDRLRQGQTP